MDTPTASDVQGWSQLNFAELGYSGDPAVQVLVDYSTGLLTAITGQTFPEMPTEFVALAQQAVRGLTEQAAYQGSPEYLETLSDFDLIQSFSAGPYSETRRSGEDAMKARKLNAWPWLSDLLWRLLTPDKYDYWTEFFAGINAPGFAVTEVDWEDTGMLGDASIWGA